VPKTEAVWEMYLSSTSHHPPLNQLLWYEDWVKIGSQEGWWLFPSDQAPDSLINVLKID